MTGSLPLPDERFQRQLEIGGRLFGFVGGGLQTPMRTPYELPDDEYAAKVAALGPVDVLCAHIPPNIPELRRLAGEDDNERVRATREVNERVAGDHRVISAMVGIADGVTIAVKV